MSIVVIGDALIDEMRNGTRSVDAPGGSALNVAAGLAILGVPATLVAMIGADADGRTLTEHLTGYGVDVLSSPSALGTGRAISDRSNGEPSYSFTPAQVQRRIDFDAAAGVLRSADIIAVSGFPFDNQEQFNSLREAIVGATVLVDPNPRPGLLIDRDLFAANLEALAPSIAVLKLGDDDVRLLWGDSMVSVAERFVAAGTGAVLATEGARGATVHTRSTPVHREIVELPEPIVDTMGAGDATFSAVIAGYGERLDWRALLGAAMAIAAETIRHHGGTLRIPSHGER